MMCRTHTLLVFVWVLVMTQVEPGAAQPATASRRPAAGSTQERFLDVVLTAITDDGSAIVMASLALPHARFEKIFRGTAPQWRFRFLPLHHTLRATSVSLTADGSKAIVTTNGKFHTVDLAQRVLEIPQTPSSAPARYTREWIPFVGPGDNTALVGDAPKAALGIIDTDSRDCSSGIVAVARTTTGDVWALGANAALCRGAISNAGILRLEELAHLNETSLILVHRASDVRIVSSEPQRYALIDPASGARVPLSNVDTTTEALLLAAGRIADERGADHRSAVKRLARELDAQVADALAGRHAGPR